MKKKLLSIFLFMMLVTLQPIFVSAFPNNEIITKMNESSSPQLCDVVWSRTYGGDEFDMFHCVHQTQDGGYITSGATEVSNRYFPMLTKLDSNGNEEWQWTISQISYEQVLYDIQDVYPIFCNQVSDGGYIFCLWIDIDHDETLHTIAGLFKFNENGGLVWNEFYSDHFEWIFRPISFIEVEDCYALAGTSGPTSSYMGDEAGLLKTDKTGKEQWYQEYDFGDADNNDNRMEAVCKTSDGGFILAGWGSDTSYDYWIIKTDENGNKIWDKTFGGSGNDYGHNKDCYQTSDGGYVVGGFSSSFGAGRSDAWIVKTDSSGNMLWDKTYGGTKNDVCWGLENSDDGGFVAVVTMNYGGFSGDKDDINIVKIDSKGNIEWVQKYDGPDIQIGSSIDKTDDGGFIVSGATGSYYSSKSDALLVKFGPFENHRPDKPDKPSGPTSGKPGIEYTFSTISTDPDGDQLFYKWDWGDSNFSDWLDTNEALYTWTGEDSYNIRVMAKDINCGESDWSDPLPFSTPKNKAINRPFINFLQKIIERFPLLSQLLQLSIFTKLLNIR